MILPKSVTIQIDTREQAPLIFPAMLDSYPLGRLHRFRLLVEHIKLDAGDYSLKETPESVGIERKASMEELCKNFCTKDWRRQRKALERFTEAYAKPYILIEMSPRQLTTQSSHTKIPPGKMLTRFFTACSDFHLRPLVVGAATSVTSRFAVGQLAAHLLINPIINDFYEGK